MQPVALGDVVLTSALLDDLHRAFPDARLDFLTGAAAAPLLVGHPLIANTLTLTRRTLSDIRTMRRGTYDLLVDPSSTPRTALLTACSGVPVRVGYAVRRPRAYAYTHRVPRHPVPPLYSVLDRKRLLTAVGIGTAPSNPRIFLTERERADGLAAVRASGAPDGRAVVGISFTAALPRKWWPPERWAAVCRGITAVGVTPVVFAAPGDGERLAAFRNAGGDAVVVAPRPLREFLAMLPACALLVSPDTGPAHFARAVSVPTVTLYVRGAAAVWNPGTPDAIAVEPAPDVACPECGLSRHHTRHVIHTCMLSITAADVVGAVQRGLSRAR